MLTIFLDMKVKVKELDKGMVLKDWGEFEKPKVLDVESTAVRDLFNPNYKIIVTFDFGVVTFTDPNQEVTVINYEEYKAKKVDNFLNEIEPQFDDEAVGEIPEKDLKRWFEDLLDLEGSQVYPNNLTFKKMFIRLWLYWKNRYWQEGYQAGYDDGSIGK